MRFIALEVVVPPAGLPVTIDEFVDHARLNGITVDRQPDLIQRELTAATQRAEKFLRRSVLTQTLKGLFWSGDCPACAASRVMMLPRGRVQSVVSVTTGGAAPPDELEYSLRWNVITLSAPLYYPDATVEWVSGYGDTGADVPDSVKEGILEYATVLYCDRNGERPAKYAADAGGGVPRGIRDLWRSEQIELSG